ncbi:unnamed protein product, partial [Scytosiphon promiscuus]
EKSPPPPSSTSALACTTSKNGKGKGEFAVIPTRAVLKGRSIGDQIYFTTRVLGSSTCTHTKLGGSVLSIRHMRITRDILHRSRCVSLLCNSWVILPFHRAWKPLAEQIRCQRKSLRCHAERGVHYARSSPRSSWVRSSSRSTKKE